ncbi:MAG TPA: hypothetical protein VL137_08220 [Polyangiaceae bacterium]|nr:hypothetical protein [Polyangiaceae bacterium]
MLRCHRVTGPIATLTVLAAGLASGCNRQEALLKPAPSTQPSSAPAASVAASTAPSTLPAASAERAMPSESQASASDVSPPAETPAETPAGTQHPAVLFDEAVPIAPSAPATATPTGVLLVTRNGELRVAPLGTLAAKSRPSKSPLKPLTEGAESFRFVRGPSVSPSASPSVNGEIAYWISGHRLLRQPFTAAGARDRQEVLATDALPATRVALPATTQPAKATAPTCAAYLASDPADATRSIAKLWIAGAASVTLTEPGAAASSIALSWTPSGLLAWALEGRTGMTSLHAREIHFAEGKALLLPDRVAWLGGASQSYTEISAVDFPSTQPRALMALEQDATSFGLVDLVLTPGSDEGESSWHPYLNGIDPAPVATALLCGTAALMRAVPQSKELGSPQQLELVSVTAAVHWPSVVLQTAKRFLDLSLVAVPGGALLVSVTDQQTWAMTLRCRNR